MICVAKLFASFLFSKLVDTTPPEVIACPNNITREIELGSTDPIITWFEPFATDIGEVTSVSTHQPGTPFQVGTTLVVYTFTDDAIPPNSADCRFFVIVTTGMCDRLSLVLCDCDSH